MSSIYYLYLGQIYCLKLFCRFLEWFIRLTITIVAENFVLDFAGESVQQINKLNILFKLSYHLWQMDMQNFTGSRKILQR